MTVIFFVSCRPSRVDVRRRLRVVHGGLGRDERPSRDDGHDGVAWQRLLGAQATVEHAPLAWDDARMDDAAVVVDPFREQHRSGGGGDEEKKEEEVVGG